MPIPPDEPSSVYVYALVEPAGCVADGLLLEGSPRVAAVCEPLELDALPALDGSGDELAHWARHHDVVVRALAEQVPVLPVRMGTMCERPRLAGAIAAAETELLAQLARVRHRHEWRVRTRHRGSGPGSPRATRPESGTSYLLRRRDELAAPPDQGGRDAFTAVDALVRSFGAVPGELRDDGNAGQSRSYLVPDAVVAELSAALEPLCDRWAARGTDVELSGPLPAYSFADVRLGAAS